MEKIMAINLLMNVTAPRYGKSSLPRNRKSSKKTARFRQKIDLLEGTLTTEKQVFVVLAPGELDDDISDLFAHLPEITGPRVSYKSRNEDGSVFLGEGVIARAEEIKTEWKEQAKINRAETRRINAEARKAQGLPARNPAQSVALTGTSIPSTIRGRISITGEMQAKTGKALIISVAFRNKIYEDLVVWAGANQSMIIAANDDGKAIDLTVGHHENKNFRPWIKAVG